MTYQNLINRCTFFIIICFIGTSLSGQRHLTLNHPINPNGPQIKEANTSVAFKPGFNYSNIGPGESLTARINPPF